MKAGEGKGSASRPPKSVARQVLEALALIVVIWIVIRACTYNSSSIPERELPCEGQVPDLTVAPSVVRIKAQTPDGTAYGTGFIVDKQHGYILTATHVVADTQNNDMEVTFRNKVSRQATRVAQFTATDISLLKAKDVGFPEVSFDLGYEAAIGDIVFAVGWTDETYIASPGVIERIATDNAGWKVIHTYTPVTPVRKGMSGGPLVDPCGNVLGIISQNTVSLSGDKKQGVVAIALSKSAVDGLVDFAAALLTPTPTSTPTPTLTPVSKRR